MPRKCVVCNKLYVKGSDDSFHSFPKDKARKQLWLSACKIRFHLPSHKVCRDHFSSEHYLPSGYLKNDAIPFITPISTGIESSNPSSAIILCAKPIVSTNTNIVPADHTYYCTSSPCPTPMKRVEPIVLTIRSGIEPSNLQSTSITSPSLQKRRRKINANTIGDLSPSHFSSPEDIKKYLNMVKCKFREKQVENANLKKHIKRLKTKLLAYESIIQKC